MASFQDVISQKRETFHIKQEKQKREKILQTKRKLMLLTLKNENTQYTEPKFKLLHEEICNAEGNREDLISTLLNDIEIMDDILCGIQQGYDKKTPLLILHNLCWTQSLQSIRKLVKQVKVHQVYFEQLTTKGQPQDNTDIIEICIGGICNLLGLFTQEVLDVTTYFLDQKILSFFIEFGNSLVERQIFGKIYGETLRCLDFILQSVRYFNLDQRLSSQEIFDIFRLSLYAFESEDEITITKMLKIIVFSTQSLESLIQFLDEQWINKFLRQFRIWILLSQESRVVLCLRMIHQLFVRSSDKYINMFFNDSILESLLFQASHQNKELVFQILKRLIDFEEESISLLFVLHINEILNDFSNSNTQSEMHFGSQLILLILQTHLDKLSSHPDFSNQGLLQHIEDIYMKINMQNIFETLQFSLPETKTILLECVYEILVNLEDSILTPKLQQIFESELVYPISNRNYKLIESILEIIIS